MGISREDTIGEWTVTQLNQYLASQREDAVSLKAPVITCDELYVTDKAILYDEVTFSQTQFTVGGTGTSSALPANPLGYFKVKDRNGTTVVIPYYKAI